MIVLMPVAMPTSDCGTAATMRFAIDANPNATPAPRNRPARSSSNGVSWRTTSRT
jgi:hypothetical protein